ncbi:hypothetical protein [Cupriavidus basilensis]|uniref:hypothetical protein n=1 Tax=Cupriavidus basilensis TaxID=68895 RepID=UPI0009E1DA3B|nr:hypothetical protein [Cupriavidus basilensis]
MPATRHNGAQAKPWRPRLRAAAAVLASVLSLAACSRARIADAENNMTMRPSVTYLHLLRHTPFFTSLSTDQLQWVIDHSREWEVDAGAVLSRRGPQGPTDTDYWILLDGGWRVEHDGKSFPSGHADPGKWFNTRQTQDKPGALVATEHGYVMRIPEGEMQVMLDRGFAFDAHLEQGRAYYQKIFRQ